MQHIVLYFFIGFLIHAITTGAAAVVGTLKKDSNLFEQGVVFTLFWPVIVTAFIIHSVKELS